MPSYEVSGKHDESPNTGNAYSYDTIISTCRDTTLAGDPLGRTRKVSVSLRNIDSLREMSRDVPSGIYQKTASADLSVILMPFQTASNVSGSLPGFASGCPTNYLYPSGNVNLTHVLPMVWDRTASGMLTDRHVAPSGDCLASLHSSDRYNTDLERYRDISNIRSIGIRLPAMGVGWGYTLNEGQPWPSGNQSSSDSTTYPSGTMFFKGGLTRGTELDPSDYVAAPIDFRYDQARHVWTCGGGGLPPGQGRFKVLMLGDDKGYPPTTPIWDWPRFHTLGPNS